MPLDGLRQEIQQSLRRNCEEVGRIEEMRRALARPGFALSPDGPCRAGVLVLRVYQAIRGTLVPVAFTAAAGVEMLMEAAYMFDAIADGDAERLAGRTAGEELALAVCLQTCGLATAAEAVESAGAGLDALLRLHRHCMAACHGQFLDARLQALSAASTSEALDMTQRKAGNIGRMAAEFGAAVALADTATSALFSEFGHNLFTYLQLIDDLRDACPSEGQLADLLQEKKTVPLVFFRRAQGEQAFPSPHDIVRQLAYNSCRADLRRAFESSGAAVFTAILAETFLNRAKQDLSELRLRHCAVDQLESLVSAREITPQEVLAIP